MSTSMRAAALVDVVSGNGRPPKALLEPTKMENQVEVQCSFQQIRQSTKTLGTLGTLGGFPANPRFGSHRIKVMAEPGLGCCCDV